MKKLLFAVALAVVGSSAMAITTDFLKTDVAFGYVFNMTFTQKRISADGSKVETVSLKGMHINRWNGQYVGVAPNRKPAFAYETYIWDPKEKQVVYNEYMGYNAKRRVTVKSCIAKKYGNFKLESSVAIITKGKKTAYGPVLARFNDTDNKWYGVGTGSLTSISGNMVTFCSSIGKDMYGTWKIAYDAGSTKLSRTSEKTIKNPKTNAKVSLSHYETTNRLVDYLLGKKGASLSTNVVW